MANKWTSTNEEYIPASQLKPGQMGETSSGCRVYRPYGEASPIWFGRNGSVKISFDSNLVRVLPAGSKITVVSEV